MTNLETPLESTEPTKLTLQQQAATSQSLLEKLLILDEIFGCSAVLYIFPHCIADDFESIITNYAIGFSVPTLWDMLNDLNRIRQDVDAAERYHTRT